MERRDFLKLSASAALSLGFQSDSLSLLLGRSAVTLTRPVLLQSGDTIENTNFLIGDDFQWDTTFSAFYCGDRSDVTFRNVTIQTTKGSWDPRWNDPFDPQAGPGIVREMRALLVSGARRLVVENVVVRGFPRDGIAVSGLQESRFADVRVDLCQTGLYASYERPSVGCHFENVHVRDTWGGGGVPSAVRPGGYLGGVGIALGALRACSVRGCSALGENSGMKLLNPQFVTVSQAFVSTFMVQGDVIPGVLEAQCQSVVVEKSVIDKSHGRSLQVSGANAFQVSDRVSGLLVVDCTLHGGGHDGHGMQLVRECDANVRGCTFVGFNGLRGGQPAYAVELLEGCRINADFLEVNRFFDQQYLLRDAR